MVAQGCDRSPDPLRSCADHLGGVWQTADGAARWHIVDGGERLDAYPLVRELPEAPPGTQPAPSTLELRRTGTEVAGSAVRRWHRGADICVLRAPARIRGCQADRLTLTLGDTGAPASWSPCAPPDRPMRTQLVQRIWP